MTDFGDAHGPTSGAAPGGRVRSHAAARLDREELAPLVDELARRYGDGTSPATLTLRELSLAERGALADLLGADRLPESTTRVAVARLSRALGTVEPATLRDAVEELRGPFGDRKAARAARRQARDELWAWLASRASQLPLGRGNGSAIAGWVDRVRLAGVPGGDVEAHHALLESVLRTIGRLPGDGIALASLAADEHEGDAHALDRGRSAATLVLDVVAALSGRERPADAETTRLLWEEVGVVPDPLSSTALVLGLRPVGDDPFATSLRAMADAGEPVTVTLSQLRRWSVAPLARDATVFVVENPSLVAEAVGLGWRGPPLVCSSGRPTHAVVTLLRQLAVDGANIAQHADFDAAGIGISAWLAERTGSTPWRMTENDYRAALRATRSAVPLRHAVPPTPWDPALQLTMVRCAVAVHEETVRTDLLRLIAASS